MEASKITRETYTLRQGDFVFLFETVDGSLSEIVQIGYSPENNPDIKPQFITLRRNPTAVASELHALLSEAITTVPLLKTAK